MGYNEQMTLNDNWTWLFIDCKILFLLCNNVSFNTVMEKFKALDNEMLNDYFIRSKDYKILEVAFFPFVTPCFWLFPRNNI